MIVGLVQSVGVMRYGMDAQMQPREEKMMKGGLAGSLTSLPASVTKQIASLSAPMMAAMGLLFYAQRLSVLEVRRNANIQESRRSAQASAVFDAERIVRNESNGFHPSPDTKFAPPDKDSIQDVMGG